MVFSERLRKLREERGMSQNALAEKLDIPRSSITQYENSEDAEGRLPRKDRLKQIADFFDVSIDFLIGRSNERLPNDDPDATWFRVETRGMSDQKRSKLIKEIERMSEWIVEKYATEDENKQE